MNYQSISAVFVPGCPGSPLTLRRRTTKYRTAHMQLVMLVHLMVISEAIMDYVIMRTTVSASGGVYESLRKDYFLTEQYHPYRPSYRYTSDWWVLVLIIISA